MIVLVLAINNNPFINKILYFVINCQWFRIAKFSLSYDSNLMWIWNELQLQTLYDTRNFIIWCLGLLLNCCTRPPLKLSLSIFACVQAVETNFWYLSLQSIWPDLLSFTCKLVKLFTLFTVSTISYASFCFFFKFCLSCFSLFWTNWDLHPIHFEVFFICNTDLFLVCLPLCSLPSLFASLLSFKVFDKSLQNSSEVTGTLVSHKPAWSLLRNGLYNSRLLFDIQVQASPSKQRMSVRARTESSLPSTALSCVVYIALPA